MLTLSVKTTRKKIIGTVSLVLAFIIAAILFFGDKEPEKAAESISRRITNNKEITEYLSKKGVETAGEPSSIETVLLPKDDAVFNEYCQKQKEAGFDIYPYLGKTVKKYTYPVLEKGETYVTVYVYEEKIISADIASHIEGWQKPVDGGKNIE